jgi:hypothetical protein
MLALKKQNYAHLDIVVTQNSDEVTAGCFDAVVQVFETLAGC